MAYAAAFAVGLVVMAIELTAARLLAPFFGTSLFVWTNLIGAVLAALSLGYWLGGRLADRHGGDGLRLRLYGTILAAAAFTGAVPFLVEPSFRLGATAWSWSSVSVFWPSLISIAVLFVPPMILLGLTVPMAARLCLGSVEEGGRTFGTVYGLSTFGSILGTFLPVLLTIPRLGSRGSFFLFSALLTLVAAAGLRKKTAAALSLLPLAGLFADHPMRTTRKSPSLLFEGESAYHYARVEETAEGDRALKVNEGLGAQSFYRKGSAWTGNYWDGAILLPALRREGRDFLILGLGAGSSARALRHAFPDLRLTGVEIDPLLVDLGRRYFELDGAAIETAIGDARAFLRTDRRSWDFVMIDVFRDNQVIPFHLATRDFFELVRSRLSRRGGLMMNVSAESRAPELAVLIKRTLASVFPYVYELKAHPYNTLLFAFLEPIVREPSLETLPADVRTLAGGYLSNLSAVTLVGEGEIATDDRSRVDLLSARGVFWRPLK